LDDDGEFELEVEQGQDLPVAPEGEVETLLGLRPLLLAYHIYISYHPNIRGPGREKDEFWIYSIGEGIDQN
jgi:hypothetical protein